MNQLYAGLRFKTRFGTTCFYNRNGDGFAFLFLGFQGLDRDANELGSIYYSYDRYYPISF